MVGLGALVKLKLDNNKIWKIQNLGHLVNLEWLGATCPFPSPPPFPQKQRLCTPRRAALTAGLLPRLDPPLTPTADLSFNNIEKIEGLETLVKLTDLVLFNNLITELEGLDTLQSLCTLSVGNNRLEHLGPDGEHQGLMYLRQIPSIRILNLDGNPICMNEDYRPYVLAHIKNLRYLDYRLVDGGAVTAAKERYQDQILEIEEQEATQQAEEEKRAKEAAKEARLAEANLGGLEGLLDKMLAEDKDLKKVAALDTHNSMLEESIDSYRIEFVEKVQEFTNEVVLPRRKIKVRELSDFTEARVAAEEDNMQAGIEMIAKFDRLKKDTFVAVRTEPDPAAGKSLLDGLATANEQLRSELMALEVELQEQMDEVAGVFYKLYKAEVDANVTAFQEFFDQQLRAIEAKWADKVGEQAKELMNTFIAAKDAEKEKGKGKDDDAALSMGGGGLAEYDESLKALLSDKELLVGSIVSSHESHGMAIDAKEDELVNSEKKELDTIMNDLQVGEHQRSRLRVSEIIKVVEEVTNVQMAELLAARYQDEE